MRIFDLSEVSKIDKSYIQEMCEDALSQSIYESQENPGKYAIESEEVVEYKSPYSGTHKFGVNVAIQLYEGFSTFPPGDEINDATFGTYSNGSYLSINNDNDIELWGPLSSGTISELGDEIRTISDVVWSAFIAWFHAMREEEAQTMIRPYLDSDNEVIDLSDESPFLVRYLLDEEDLYPATIGRGHYLINWSHF